MARVTVEDCIDKIPNRFELVMISGQRVRQVNSGAPITVERDNDKNTVVALREIADETVSIDELKEDMIHSYQKVAPMLEEDQEELEIMQGEEEWQQLVAAAGVVVDDENNIVDSEEAEAEQPDEDDAEAQIDEKAPSLEDLAGAK